VPESMDVCPELLIAAAVQAAQSCDDLFASHAGADATVESALSGWVGSSAAALSARAALWATATTTLSTAVQEHAEALRQSALNFVEMDRRNASAVAEDWPR
jgi:WXG100 family type VII secretion target